MLIENKEIFEFTNIDVWQNETLGEGTTVVLLDEYDLPYPYMKDIVEIPFKNEKSDTGHCTSVGGIVHQISPKSKLIYMDFNRSNRDIRTKMIDWIIKHQNEIDVINVSLAFALKRQVDEYFSKLEHLDIPIVTASGNESNIENGLGYPAKYDYTISVGAYDLRHDGITSYSNGGEGLECVAPANVNMPNTEGRIISLTGTSFASPFVAGGLALYSAWKRKNGLGKITRQEAFDVVINNAKDINKDTGIWNTYQEGFDKASGWGAFRLPPEIPMVKDITNPTEEVQDPIIPTKPEERIPTEDIMSKADYDNYIFYKQLYENAKKDGNKLATDYLEQSIRNLLNKYGIKDDGLFDDTQTETPPITPEPIPETPKPIETPIQPIDLSKIRLIIDNGHGGTDSGATSFGYMEKDLTLIIGKRVKELLKDFNPDMTRTTDKTLEPNDRTALIKDKYDYCISIHLNSGGGDGIEAIHSAHSTKGKKLAEYIVNSLKETTGLPLRNKPVFSRTQSDGKDYYYMHRNTGNTITVIIEGLFLDNAENIKKLNVESIAQGISNGFKEYAKTLTPTVEQPIIETPKPEQPNGEINKPPLLTYKGYLKKGDTGADVRSLQTALQYLGFYNISIDGSFGNGTDTALRNFQKTYGLVVDGFAGQATVMKINELLSGKVKPTMYRKIRKFDSDIHILEVGKDYHVDVDLGQRGKLEKVSTIINNKLKQGEKVVAGINGGFFNFNGSTEHIGMYIDDGLYYSPPTNEFIDFIYFKDGHTEIHNHHGYDGALLSGYQSRAYWAVGTSYSLVQNGKINLENKEKFDHANSRQPRTMIGQKKDGTFVLVVVDGRSTASKGLTAQQQAEVMLELGCYNSVSCDGGGSSCMVLAENGWTKVVNKPSDGTERLVGSVFLVYEV